MAKINQIETIIKENLDNQNSVFVFPTQTAADLWIDRITLDEKYSAIATERFIAWDDFKEKSIKNKNQDKEPIPFLMRQVFTASLIEKNSNEKFFGNLIMPEYAKDASGFTKWISKILPSLAIWKNKIQENKTELELDDEDKDYQKLYDSYKEFLDSHNLFDPAWETPPFTDDGREYFIIYPEILMDYAEYKLILEQSDKIHLISTKINKNQNKPINVTFYENSRVELTEVALYIRKLHEIDKIDWTQIALNVPDLDTYAPYIERELQLYEIPYVMRTGKMLSANPAGNFFVQAQECVQSNFSFASLKNLLLNNSIPWIAQKKNEELIEFGKENNCLCSYKYKDTNYDVWEEAFKDKKDKHEETDRQLINLHSKLKYRLSEMVNAKSFKEINEAYFRFREDFFDVPNFNEDSNKIVSRCIVELGNLIDLEEKYPDCKISNPYNFFQARLGDVKYVSQNEARGVQVFAYGLSATAPFDCQIVLDSSQDSLSVTNSYKQLTFLSEIKRKNLKIEDIDPTEDFILLYDNSFIKSKFFVAEKTFSGYAFPHGFFEVEKKIPEIQKGIIPELQYNIFTQEKNNLLEKTENDTIRYKTENTQSDKKYPNFIFRTMNESFENWNTKAIRNPIQSISKENLKAIIEEKFFDKKRQKYKISQSALKNFFKCPRYWLYKSVLQLNPLDNEALLIDKFTMGNVYHEILNVYCTSLKNNNLALNANIDSLDNVYDEFLKMSISAVLSSFDTSHLAKQLLLTDENTIYEKMQKNIIEFSNWFSGYKIIATEKNYNSIPLDKEGNEKDYFFNGKIDCLLYNEAEEEFTLIDYKSSSSSIPKNMIYDSGKPNDLPDPQMPMYKQLIENPETGQKYKVDNAGFFDLKNSEPKMTVGKAIHKYKINGNTKKPKEANGKIDSMLDFENTIERFFEMADEYVSKIKDYDFDINDETQTYSVCKDSDCLEYRATCRRFFNVSGR